MTLIGTVGNKIDANLIPENIRKDKTIFGVEGTFEGGVASKFIASFSINTGESVFGGFNGVRAIELGNYIYCFMGQQFKRSGASYEGVALCACKIDKTTLDITILSNSIYTQTVETNDLHALNSYIDGTDIYLNRGTGTDRKCYFKLDTLTDIITNTIGSNTSGILDNSIDKTIGSITYTPTIVASTPVTTNIYSGRTGILVS